MKERMMFVNGEKVSCNLRRLAKAIETGKAVQGFYRYYLFGHKPYDCEFTLSRVSDRHAVLEHLREKHKFAIEEKEAK